MQEYTVSRDESGQRLDKYLHRKLPLASTSFLYKMLRKKNITLRGRKAEGSERVTEGDLVTLYLSEETIRKFSAAEDSPGRRQEEDEVLQAFRKLQPLLGKDPVLYEDSEILLVRKPAGILSQKAAAGDLSMNEWLRGYLLERGEVSEVYKPSVCNRLDRNTGGILLCARTLQGSRALTELLKGRSLRKTYRMIVHGQVTAPGRIEGELVKDRQTNRVRPAAEGSAGKRDQELRRYAATVYRPVRAGRKTTLVEADLLTGRSHQLRVHMASMGNPILGDPKYGDPRDRKDRRLRGQLLWCTRIEFPGAESGPEMQGVLAPLAGRVFSCPVPAWWEDYL